MGNIIRETLQELFGGSKELPAVTEESTLHQISTLYPQLCPFIERKYGVKIDAPDTTLSLREFAEKFSLPPAQILFMEVQMDTRTQNVGEILPTELVKLLKQNPCFKILDVREEWELKMGSLPNALPLQPKLLDEILTEWEKDTPVILYCHFGIRSLDAAAFLADRGFTKVSILKGGIDAWSDTVDPSIPKYQGAYC